MTARFAQTYCSQCGAELGPGDAGVSHCDEHKPVNSYIVTIGAKGRTRLLFEVMARSSSEAQERHEDLAELGERCEVFPVQVDLDAMRCSEAL